MNQLQIRWAIVYVLAMAIFVLCLLIFYAIILPELTLPPVDQWPMPKPQIDFFRSMTV